MRNTSALDILESSARAGTWSLDLATDELWWSPGIYAILRVDPAVVKPTVASALSFYTVGSRLEIQAALAKSRRDGIGWDLELDIERADGTSCAIHVIAEPVHRDGRLIGLAGAFFDIDARRREQRERQAMARHISEQEARWQFAVQASGFGIWEWEPIEDRVQYADHWKAMLGYAVSEIGTSPAEWWDRVHPDDRAACRASLDAHIRGETALYTSEYRLLCRDGTYRWMSDRGQVVAWDREGRPLRMVGTLSDIDARKTAEAALARSEQRFRAIFDSMFQFTGLLNPDGILLEANQTALVFAQAERATVVDRPIWEGPWFQTSEGLRQRLRDAVRRGRDGEFVRFNAEIVGGKGERLIIDFSLKPFRDAGGEITLLIPEGRDITEHVAAETALRESERRFHQVFERAPIGLGLVAPDGRWQSANRELLQILGYTEAELCERTMLDVTHADDIELSSRYTAEALAGQRQAYRLEKRYLHRDGHAVEVQLDVSLLRDERGQPLHFIGQVQDITQRRTDRAALAEAKELAQVTLAAIGEGIVRVGADGRITLCNRSACELLACDESALVGRPFRDCVTLWHAQSESLLPCPVERVLQSGGKLREPDFTRLRRPDGTFLPITDSASAVRDRDGRTIGAVFVFQDVSETFRMTEELARQARRDDLTSLPNRRSFEEVLDRAWRVARDNGGRAFVMYLDLDQFKSVNDTCGHLVGDDMLRALAALLRARLRPGDHLFRLGGDEFAAIVAVDDLAIAEAVADKLIEAVSGYEFRYQGRGYRVGVSVGIAEIDSAAERPADLQARADTALYVAKEAGRRRRHSYRDADPDIQLARRSLDVAQHIQLALDHDRFDLYLQAIVAGDHSVHGYEALVRMRAEDGSILTPAAFLPAANRLGLISRIDEWVLRAVLGLIRRRQRAGQWPRDCYITVNLSARSVGDPLFQQRIMDLLHSYATPVAAVRFEITETEGLAHDAHPRLIEALRARHYRVWLDDFGSGFNSFELLKRFDVDGVKIDGIFTDDLPGSPVNRALVESVASLGRQLQLEIVAEGVEREYTLANLRNLGIDRFQGFLFHRPEPADEALARVAPGARAYA